MMMAAKTGNDLIYFCQDFAVSRSPLDGGAPYEC